MANAAVGQLLYLLDRAFEDDEEHSLLANLRSVGPEDWPWRPPDGGRSIRQITYHAAVAKHVYANHLFGDKTLTFDGLMRTAPTTRDEGEKDLAISWMRDGHQLLHEGLASLTDDDLPREQRTHWGEVYETRRIIAVITAHDIYHAGEINHIRALRQGDDRWPWQPEAS